MGGLLQSQVKDRLAKIILFGSVARGAPKEESDVDLLIFGTEGLDEIRDLCADLRMETYFKYSESVEPLIYPLEALRQGSYFLHRAVNHGEEVYSMKEEELRIKEAHNLVRLGEEYMEGAEDALDSGHLRIAINAAYNAAELCAKGLLLLEMDELPTSHGGIVGEFSCLSMKAGKVPKELGRRLNRGLELRNKARYDYDFNAVVSEGDAIRLIELARRMGELLAEKSRRARLSSGQTQ